jgi:glycine betaine/proline transport system substrate-binding protein
MKNLVVAACLAAGISALSASTAAAECGDVSIANMNWQSAEVLASLDKFILEEGFGCTVTTVASDTIPTITSMVEKDSPDVVPEGWITLTPELLNRGMQEGKIMSTGPAISDGALQGWWIPKYVADAHPDIKTIDDALKHPELFPAPEDAAKGAVFGGPPGWAGAIVTEQFFKAYGAKAAGFDLIDIGSVAGLDGSIVKAYERKEGWLGYYWSPTALLGRYDMVKLSHGVPFSDAEWKRCNAVAECEDPKKNDWPVDTVESFITTSFAARAGDDVVSYFKKREWTNATVIGLMAWMTDNQATGDEGARYFLKEHPDLWTKWVSEEVAAKIKAAL